MTHILNRMRIYFNQLIFKGIQVNSLLLQEEMAGDGHEYHRDPGNTKHQEEGQFGFYFHFMLAYPLTIALFLLRLSTLMGLNR